MNTTSDAAAISPVPRRSWRRRIGWALLLFALAAWAFYTVENWRGRRAWEAYRQTLESRGDVLTWTPARPAVPPEQNFADTPFLVAVGVKGRVDSNLWNQFDRPEIRPLTAELYSRDGYTDLARCQSRLRAQPLPGLPAAPQTPAADVLAALQPLQPLMSELRQASSRPEAAMRLVALDPVLRELPDFAVARRLADTFCLQASAELALGRSSEAFANLFTVHRLAQTFGSGQSLVCAMVRVSIERLAVAGFWEGLAQGRWGEAQLTGFERMWQSTDLLREVSEAMRNGERNAINQILENNSSFKQRGRVLAIFFPNENLGRTTGSLLAWMMPSGWFHQNQLSYVRFMTEQVMPGIDVKAHRVRPEPLGGANPETALVGAGAGFYQALVKVAVPNFSRAYETVARTQTAIEQATLACALERYHRTAGRYPDALQKLTPDYVAKLPHDVVDGQPLRYRLQPNGGPVLYAVGWDGKDNGGELPAGSSGTTPGQADRQTDWVFAWSTAR